MEKIESNSLLIINFFKKNYIKMIAFILLSISISLILSYEYNKKVGSFYSKFQIIFNGAVDIETPLNLIIPYKDFLFYMEKNGYRDKKVLRSRHANDIVQIEIKHKDLNDKGSKQYNEYLILVENYKNELLSIIDTNIKKYIENTNNRIIEVNSENLKGIYEAEILNYLNNAKDLKRMITNDNLLYVNYDGIIHSRIANTLLLKNAIITLCINIIIISLILWSKIFLREIKKNS